MNTMRSDKRKSGISIIGELPWGSHFCQFYRNMDDLLDILLPYFKAGIENNELCVWVSCGASGGDAGNAAALFEKYLEEGRMEIIPRDLWSAMQGRTNGAVVSMLDRAVRDGFDGLRLSCTAFPETEGDEAFTVQGLRDISRHNVIALFAYPHDEFGAVGLMEQMKNHRFALVGNAGAWEVIESSEARLIRGELHRSDEKLKFLLSGMSEGFAHHRIVLDAGERPCDYVFLEINEAFERITGLSSGEVLGRKVTDVLPGIEKDPADWIGKFGKVALSGEPLRFESYSKPLGRWYSVSAFSPHKGFFAVTFSEITVRREAEQEVLKLNEELRSKVAELSEANNSMRDSRRAALNLMEDAVIARRQSEEASVCLLREVAERRLAEETLREREEQFRRAIEDAPIPIIMHTDDGQVLQISRSWTELTGYAPQDVPTLDAWLDNAYGEGAETVREYVRELFRGDRRTINIDFPIRTRDDSVRHWSFNASSPGTLADGRRFVVGMAVDITERKLAEEWLEKEYREIALAHRFLRLFVEKTGDELYGEALDVLLEEMKCRHGVFGYIDERGYLVCPSLSGMLAECEVEGKCIEYPPEKWAGLWARALREKRTFFANEPPTVPPGHVHIRNNMAVPILFQGNVIGLFNLANRETDFTETELEFIESIANRIAPVFYAHLQRQFREQERMAAEETLRKAHDELEAKVAERTTELREKDRLLMQQSRQAAMGEMIGNIAHQWRQPLNTLGLIIGTLPMMQATGELTRESLESLEEKAMGVIQHMSQTINDFSNYFKPDKERAPFNAGTAVARTVTLIEDSFNSRRISIELATEDDPIINGYPNEFSQALLNILMNARDAFSDQNIAEPRVVIGMSAENGRAVVTVTDNAGGIPEEIMDKIFDPYFTTKGPEMGTGVGLFMSKGIIEKNMGGRLSARNTGDGAEFRIEV